MKVAVQQLKARSEPVTTSTSTNTVQCRSSWTKSEAAFDLPRDDDKMKIEHAAAQGSGLSCAESTAVSSQSTLGKLAQAATRSCGRPLDVTTRAAMESWFGHDFSRVRVHSDQRAGEAARAMGARAFTLGSEIVFAPGQYDTHSAMGQTLLAHELTHVAQQAGTAQRTDAVTLSTPNNDLEREAQVASNDVVASRLAPRISRDSGPPMIRRAIIETLIGTGLSAVGLGAVGLGAGTTAIIWPPENYTSSATNASSTTVERPFGVTYSAVAEPATNNWRMQVSSIGGGVDMKVHTGGSRDPLKSPPTSEAQAAAAVTDMKGYYSRGFRGSWHTEAASRAHERHHYKEWRCASNHYWPATQKAIEHLTVPQAVQPTAAAAITAMRAGAAGADAKIAAFAAKAHQYWFTLADNAKSRPYAAGQLTLNNAVRSVQALAASKRWKVPAGTDNPSDANPCYQPWLPYSP